MIRQLGEEKEGGKKQGKSVGLVFRVKMLEACNRVTPDEGRNDTLKNTIMIIIRRGESCRG